LCGLTNVVVVVVQDAKNTVWMFRDTALED
jgi:hypothetical protein